MNESHDGIFAEFRDADFNRRQHMYLRFRDLRSKFILIQRNDLNTDFSAIVKSPGNGREALAGIIGRKFSCFRENVVGSAVGLMFAGPSSQRTTGRCPSRRKILAARKGPTTSRQAS